MTAASTGQQNPPVGATLGRLAEPTEISCGVVADAVRSRENSPTSPGEGRGYG
jgi:hypothetical protein